MGNDLSFCMITVKEREKRKLIYLPSHHAQDYFSYCEEVGCEWEGLLNSIPEKFEPAALIELPDKLVENGFSKIAAGVEVPLDYDKELPETYKTVELPESNLSTNHDLTAMVTFLFSKWTIREWRGLL